MLLAALDGREHGGTKCRVLGFTLFGGPSADHPSGITGSEASSGLARLGMAGAAWHVDGLLAQKLSDVSTMIGMKSLH
jgi:hypothetical protein